MRILVINYEFPPVGGGGGRVAQDLCREFVKLGHDVRVQTSKISGLQDIEDKDGYTIYRTNSFRRSADRCTFLEMAAFLICNFFPCLRHVVKWKPDLIHIHFAVPTGVLGWLLFKLTGTPYVITAHLGDIPGGNPEQTDHVFKIIKPITMPIWKSATAVTVHSQYTHNLAKQSYDIPITIIPNGMDLSGFPQSPSPASKPRRLVFAGRFIPQKNTLFLLDVLQKVKEFEWEMDLFGDGPLGECVRLKTKEYGLEQKINLRGWVSPEGLDQALRDCDILCLPSLSESMPIVAVRAVGFGAAVLASDISGLYDLVKNGVNGFLCQTNNLEEFKNALVMMLESDELVNKMKQESFNLARQFDITLIARRYEELFRKVIKCDA